MRKYIIVLCVGLLSIICTSCITSSYAETSVGNEDISLIVRYGTPYYYNGTLSYYLYNGYYFYPYRYYNRTYFHKYRRPLPPPRRHDYRPPMPPQNRGGHFGRPSQPPRNNGTIRPSTPSRGDRPMRGNTRPNFGGRR